MVVFLSLQILLGLSSTLWNLIYPMFHASSVFEVSEKDRVHKVLEMLGDILKCPILARVNSVFLSHKGYTLISRRQVSVVIEVGMTPLVSPVNKSLKAKKKQAKKS